MADEIRANYEQLEQVAAKLANQAEAIQQMLQTVRGGKDKLQDGGWIGRGSDAFLNEMDDIVLPATVRLNEALEQASQATRAISQVLKQAEDQASAPFRQSN